MKTYAVKTRFSFTGHFFIEAESKEEAKDFALNGCGLVMGGKIHTAPYNKDIDWEFPIHPETTILNIRVGICPKTETIGQ